MWILKTFLDGVYHQSVWQTQEGTIARREQMLAPKRVKMGDGFKVICPTGWTAITRKERHHG